MDRGSTSDCTWHPPQAGANNRPNRNGGIGADEATRDKADTEGGLIIIHNTEYTGQSSPGQAGRGHRPGSVCFKPRARPGTVPWLRSRFATVALPLALLVLGVSADEAVAAPAEEASRDLLSRAVCRERPTYPGSGGESNPGQPQTGVKHTGETAVVEVLGLKHSPVTAVPCVRPAASSALRTSK
jgi:hypothetical protein